MYDIRTHLVVVGIAEAVQAWEGLRKLKLRATIGEAMCTVGVPFGTRERLPSSWIDALTAITDEAARDGNANPLAACGCCAHRQLSQRDRIFRAICVLQPLRVSRGEAQWSLLEAALVDLAVLIFAQTVRVAATICAIQR